VRRNSFRHKTRSGSYTRGNVHGPNHQAPQCPPGGFETNLAQYCPRRSKATCQCTKHTIATALVADWWYKGTVDEVGSGSWAIPRSHWLHVRDVSPAQHKKGHANTTLILLKLSMLGKVSVSSPSCENLAPRNTQSIRSRMTPFQHKSTTRQCLVYRLHAQLLEGHEIDFKISIKTTESRNPSTQILSDERCNISSNVIHSCVQLKA
jgi:hypothetical protein